MAALLARAPLRLTIAPRGTRHEIVGVLLRSGDDLVLGVSGGGAWRFDLGGREAWRGRSLVGTLTRVAGTRAGFDLLAIDRIDRMS